MVALKNWVVDFLAFLIFGSAAVAERQRRRELLTWVREAEWEVVQDTPGKIQKAAAASPDGTRMVVTRTTWYDEPYIVKTVEVERDGKIICGHSTSGVEEGWLTEPSGDPLAERLFNLAWRLAKRARAAQSQLRRYSGVLTNERGYRDMLCTLISFLRRIYFRGSLPVGILNELLVLPTDRTKFYTSVDDPRGRAMKIEVVPAGRWIRFPYSQLAELGRTALRSSSLLRQGSWTIRWIHWGKQSSTSEVVLDALPAPL